ncbi:MAG: 4a-hydroxytetrahydrobiopterin dehydratase [Thermoguttaceae bacterium]
MHSEQDSRHCSDGASPLKKYLAVVLHWILAADGKRIRRKWVAKDFLSALDFFKRVGRIAQAEDHHPDLATRPHKSQRLMAPPCSFGSLP